jgi:hypothetical protein
MKKAEAQKAANRLLKLMKGRGWKVMIEGSGDNYKYRVELGCIAVYPINYPFDGYFCLFGTHCPKGGPGFWKPAMAKTYADPNEAVLAQIAATRDCATRMLEAVQTVEEAVKG